MGGGTAGDQIPVSISFDYEKGICRKNDYEFRIDPIEENDRYFLKKEELERILTSTITYERGSYQVTRNDYSDYDWAHDPLIAHAGGTVRDIGALTDYTNSYDALYQNYSLGMRVFEFDMYPTSDDEIALAHDWIMFFGPESRERLSTREWLAYRFNEELSARGGYRTMMIGNLLDEMIVNPDMFIVTDTKSFEFPPEEIRHHFEIIRDEAMKRDPDLLKRIIPQLYNIEMYDIVKSVYPFPNMIFTCYAAPEESAVIVDFCIDHEEIQAVTAPLGAGRLTPEEIEKLHKNGRTLYYHSIYTYAEMVQSFAEGADGIYTGIFTPDDIRDYQLATSMAIS